MNACATQHRSPADTERWLRQGQWHEGRGHLDAALASYDHALAGAPEPRASSVAWMNRGSVLQRFGDRERTLAALDAYDEAIARLRALASAGNPALRVSLAAALLNRSLLLYRLHGCDRAAAALAASNEAESWLRPLLPTAAAPVVRRNLAGVLVNRANLRLDLGDAAGAADLARDAVTVITDLARRDFDCAHVTLLARRALCAALGRLLVCPGVDQDAIVTEASDVVDAALDLARAWSAREAADFGPLVPRLFLFGARLYRVHQPHFLAEFLLEHLETAPTPELLAHAAAAIAAALTDLERPHLLVAGHPETERLRATVRDLRAAQARVASLSSLLPALSA